MLLEEGVYYDQCVLLAKLLAFALLYLVPQGQPCLLLQISLDSYFCIPVPYDENDIVFFFLVLVLEGLVGFHRTFQLQFLRH